MVRNRWLVGAAGLAFVGSAWGAEPAFAWPETGELRTLGVWEAVVTAPDGQTRRMSGTVRGGWVWAMDGERLTVRQRAGRVVQVLPYNDPVAAQIAEALVLGWEVDLDRAGRPSAEPAPEVSPTETVSAQAPVVEDEPASAEPEVDVDAAQLVAWLAPRPQVAFATVFGALSTDGLEVGAGVRHSAARGLEVWRELKVLPYCPTEGPGTDCFLFEQVRASGGATLTLLPDAPGQRLVRESWVLTEQGAVPQRLTRDVRSVWLGVGGVWRVQMSQDVRFLPGGPPPALSR